MRSIQRVTILGTGGMGTALAMLWVERGGDVILWGRDPVRVTFMDQSRSNPWHLPSAKLPIHNLQITSDPDFALANPDVVVMAVPSAYLRSTLGPLALRIPPQCPLLSVVKGMEVQTHALPSQIAREELGPRTHAVLSGPSHAEELIKGLPASFVVACHEAGFARHVQESLNQGMIRVYTNTDVLGVELAGALKNVLAIAAGICEGLGLGDNAKAALLTRGLAEIARYALHQGADRATFYGLAGVGDLLTTCYSQYGRNRQVGWEVGRGRSLSDLLASMSNVAEGVTSATAVAQQAELLGVEMPICHEVNLVLHHGKSPREALHDLMVRAPKVEWYL